MALAYFNDDDYSDEKLIVFTFLKELGYGSAHSGNWWAQRALLAIADDEARLRGIITRWTFPLGTQIAVERIIASRGRRLSLLPSKHDVFPIIKQAFAEKWQDDLYSNPYAS
ncbi:MAG: hypothetical protein ACOCYT_00535 [Chloroflexota bacterium]